MSQEGMALEIERLYTKANERITTLERELAEARRDSVRWQPIETAPKDGTRILLAWLGKTRVAWWHKNEHPLYKNIEGFWKVPSLETTPVGSYPTHWMPLPSPPDAALAPQTDAVEGSQGK